MPTQQSTMSKLMQVYIYAHKVQDVFSASFSNSQVARNGRGNRNMHEQAHIQNYQQC